jgi:hypothetical protein
MANRYLAAAATWNGNPTRFPQLTVPTRAIPGEARAGAAPSERIARAAPAWRR